MPYQKVDLSEQMGLLERVYLSLQGMMEQDAAVDIITFAESPKYLGRKLYPRQRLALKLYYKLPLERSTCVCYERNRYYADKDCPYCGGSGIYDELEDVKRLIRGVDAWGKPDRYARLYHPTVCVHHLTGECSVEECHRRDKEARAAGLPSDYRTLADDELRERLVSHHAHILEAICGRRSGKSVLGAFVNAYEQYKLLRDPNPQTTWGLIPGQPIGTANVATDETQALVLFSQLKALIDNSPWYRMQRYRLLETLIDFPGRNLFSRSMHSNSASVRGQTLIAIFLDEFCHFNRTGGKLSDKAMWAALAPSVLTFKEFARIVITSSPLNKAGVAYDWFHLAEVRQTEHVIAMQVATWEFNPHVSRTDPEIMAAFALDPDYAEMEFGAQWAETVGVWIPVEAIEGCLSRGPDGTYRSANLTGTQGGLRYQLHMDLSHRHDRTGLVVTHWDKERRKVVLDLVVEFDPKKGPDYGHNGDVVNERDEIDVEKLYTYVTEHLYKRCGFRFNSITFDQFNSMWLSTALRKFFNDPEGRWIGELTITDKLNRSAYANLRSIIVQGGLDLYRHHELISQLATLAKKVKEGSVQWTVEAPPGFHDDLADSLAFATMRCLELSVGISSGLVLISDPHSQGGAGQNEVVHGMVPDGSGAPIPYELFQEGFRHSARCRPDSCVFDCPVLQATVKLKQARVHAQSGEVPSRVKGFA